jgi:Zn-dependent peptidase ImmA (M78 family)/transcriptional regulator with XRE-family HTH domain
MAYKSKKVNSILIILARESRGITQQELAEKLSVSQGWLSRVEGGLRGIQDTDLKKLSAVLDYPPEFFLQDDKIYGPNISEMFNRKRQNITNKILNAVYAQVSIRSMNIEKLLRGVNIGEVSIRQIDLGDFDGKPKEVARIVRAGWRLPKGPVQSLVDAIENQRAIIIPFDFKTNKIDAMSHWQSGIPPLFFVNRYSPADRLRFTLCHEVGHIVMHQENIDPNMENQADEFASEFLMPESDIRPYLKDLSLEKLATLKQYWKVSMAALLKRASDLGEITPRQARTLWTQMSKAGYRLREPVEIDLPKESPSLLGEFLMTYIVDMRYTTKELAELLCLSEKEMRDIYLDSNSHKASIENERRAAIRSAEEIIKKAYKETS